MDNSNNSNWPNNPSSLPNGVATPPSDPLAPNNPFPATTPPAPNPADTAGTPFSFSSPAATLQPGADQLASNPTLTSTPAPSPWDLPAQADPVQQNPVSTPQDPSQSIPAPQTSPELVSMEPEHVDPQATPVSSANGSIGTSPLDNPWGSPVQPPALDGIPATPPNPMPADNTAGGLPSWLPNSPEPLPTTQPPSQIEPAPTDLSHLISNNSQSDSSQPPSQDPETLVVPPTTPETSATIPTENHKSFPKWLIGVGLGLLLVVAGASAYFILGVGQTPKTADSVPATQETTQQTIKNIAPPPVATPASQPVASGSANFGELEGDQAAPAAANSGATQQATSAAELLRQRQ